jgi:hypothetical protein
MAQPRRAYLVQTGSRLTLQYVYRSFRKISYIMLFQNGTDRCPGVLSFFWYACMCDYSVRTEIESVEAKLIELS